MNDKDRTSLSTADMEQNTGDAPPPQKTAPSHDSRINIRVISYRRLKHDPDGVSVKAVLDGLVRRGILADDSTEQIASITFESRKAKEERTIIEIKEIDDERCSR